MMGRRDGQMAMVFVDMESLIPENHLLRKIDRIISFEFIYDLLAPYYPSVGRPSVDPVCMFKMLLVGYLYGIKSERRLEEEVRLNLAYCWFCGFELDEAIPASPDRFAAVNCNAHSATSHSYGITSRRQGKGRFGGSTGTLPASPAPQPANGRMAL